MGMFGVPRLLSWVALAMALAIRLPVPFALCTASDGHRAIEPMHASCCERAHSEMPRAVPGCTEGACIDTPLGGDPMLRNVDGDRASDGHLVVALPASVDLVPALAVDRASLCRPAVQLPSPRQRHTTVFLC